MQTLISLGGENVAQYEIMNKPYQQRAETEQVNIDKLSERRT